jgi:hypothetical protein
LASLRDLNAEALYPKRYAVFSQNSFCEMDTSQKFPDRDHAAIRLHYTDGFISPRVRKAGREHVAIVCVEAANTQTAAEHSRPDRRRRATSKLTATIDFWLPHPMQEIYIYAAWATPERTAV